MSRWSILWIFLLVILLVIVLGFAVWVYLLPKPRTGVDCHKTTDWVWAPNCNYIEEKFYDPTLKSPKSIKPYLVGFTHASGGGPPIYLPMWYRIRYVNVKTGGYSDFSEWSASPVISGSCKLPCDDGVGKCEKPKILQGYNTCLFNQPTIGVSIKDSAYSPTTRLSDGSFVWINLHRYVGVSSSDASPPPPNAKDKIIGYMASEQEGFYTWIDVLDNPCLEQSCQLPTWCQTESKCS